MAIVGNLPKSEKENAIIARGFGESMDQWLVACEVAKGS